VTPPDKPAILEHVVGSYRDSFVVEQRIARALESVAATVFAITPERVSSPDALKDVIDRLGDAVRELVNQRPHPEPVEGWATGAVNAAVPPARPSTASGRGCLLANETDLILRSPRSGRLEGWAASITSPRA